MTIENPEVIPLANNHKRSLGDYCCYSIFIITLAPWILTIIFRIFHALSKIPNFLLIYITVITSVGFLIALYAATLAEDEEEEQEKDSLHSDTELTSVTIA